MMPRDKAIFAVQGIIVAYVLYEVATSVYQHLKAKDRLKRAYTRIIGTDLDTLSHYL